MINSVIYFSYFGMLLLVSGCATAMQQQNKAWGGQPDEGKMAAAVAFDIVTLPAQLPIFAFVSLTSKSDINNDAYKAKIELQNLIKENPSIVLEKKLHQQSDKHIIQALSWALGNDQVMFTEPMLRTIFAETKSQHLKSKVFYHLSSGSTFIIEYFDYAYKRAQKSLDSEMLYYMARNTNTPNNFLIMIASNSNFSKSLRDGAKYTLFKKTDKK